MDTLQCASALREQACQLDVLLKKCLMYSNSTLAMLTEPHSPDTEDARLIETRVAERFERLIRVVEAKAKGVPFDDSSGPTGLSEILRNASTQPVPHLTNSQRKTVRNLLNSARLERENASQSDTVSNSGSSLTPSKGVSSRKAKKHGSFSRTDRSESQMIAISWPNAEHGLFCLLRAILTQDGERRRSTTSQLCEYVREWQARNGYRLQRMGGPWSWLSRAEDWSSLVPYALQFLTAEIPASSQPSGTSATGSQRHSSRRLTCPRPFLDSRPRLHQWSWLLLPSNDRFDAETKELDDLFTEWVRTPRGLGGLADAEWNASQLPISSHSRKKLHSKVASGEENDSDDSGRLQIVGNGSDTEESVKKFKMVAKRRKVDDQPSARPGPIDDSIPPPLCPTTWKLRPFTTEEKRDFQAQERERFSKPWLPFVYTIQDYKSIVGPLRSAPSASDQRAQLDSHPGHLRARDHPLLRSDRPIHVSVAEIVRDAVACLPNGEGSRSDITLLVQNSGFLRSTVHPRKLQQCVSSALDRLQGETSDPSVYYNPACRVWVYRHRGRTAQDFVELHEARRAVVEAKKSIQRGDGRPSTSTKPPRRMSDELGFSSRSSGPYTSDRRASNSLDEDLTEFSDSHIPDIEELEARGMLDRSRDSFYSDYSEEEEESGRGHELHQSSGRFRREELIPEDAFGDVESGDEFQPSVTFSRRPLASSSRFRPESVQRNLNAGWDDDFLEFHRALRRDAHRS